MDKKKKARLLKIVVPIFVLAFTFFCIFGQATKDFLRYAVGGPDVEEVNPIGPDATIPLTPLDGDTSPEGVTIEECDALEYINVLGDTEPEEVTNVLPTGTSNYYCIYNYVFTNHHQVSRIELSWKHMDSTLSTGSYWTHPGLEPGDEYKLRLRKDRSTNDIWTSVNANYLMAWFDTEECNLLISLYVGNENEPDALLMSGLERVELVNPCAP